MEQKQGKSKDKPKKIEPPRKAEEVAQEAPAELTPGLVGGRGAPDDILQRQADLLGNRQIDSKKRQQLAAEIGQVQGNQQLQRVMLQIDQDRIARQVVHFDPPGVQRNIPSKGAPVSAPPGGGLRTPSRRAERTEEARGGDDPVEAAQEAERARLRQWAVENWVRSQANLRVTVPPEAEHPEEQPRTLQWRTLFLGVGQDEPIVARSADDAEAVFQALDTLAEDYYSHLGGAIAHLGPASIFTTRLEQFQAEWYTFLLASEGARERGIEGAWEMAHRFMRIDVQMVSFFESRIGVEAPEQAGGARGAAEAAGPDELTQEQTAALRRLAQEMDYSGLHAGYTNLNRWLASHSWLNAVKQGISATNTAVDSYYASAGGERPDQGTLRRLKLTSKLISNKGRLDKIMLAVYAFEQVEGEERETRFDAFLNCWERSGWVDMLGFYNSLRQSRPAIRMSEEQYLSQATSNQRRAQIGEQIGQVLELDQSVRWAVVQASIRTTLDIMATLTWFGIEEVFLNRVPGWAQVKLVGQGIAAVVRAFSS
jgi:hypothetical protein